MVSLTNQARLLAAQEFNRRVIEQRAREGKLKASDTVARLDRLTGRVARTSRRGGKGKVIGLTKTKSKTRLNTEKLLRAEIKRQQELRAKETDLERFLKNEAAIRGGRVSSQELKRQIAARKRKGLRATPAQKAALAGLTRAGDVRRLRARAERKRGRGIREGLIRSPEQLLGIKASEADRAFALGGAGFADPVFEFGGRTAEEVRQRGGTFARRRVGGRRGEPRESASQQLAFVRSARVGSASARISFAKDLLGGNLFGKSLAGSSNRDLLSVVDSTRPSRDPTKRARGARSQIQFAPRTFENILREGVTEFTTEAIPFTERDAPSREARRQLVAERRREDVGKAGRARRQIAEERARQRRRSVTVDDLERTIGASLDIANRRRASAEFGFGLPRVEQIRVEGFQALEPAPTTQRVPKGKKLTPAQKRAQAEATQRETEALRAERAFGTPAIGRTFGQEEIFRPSGAQEPIPALVPATPRPSPARQEQIRVAGQRITEPTPPRDQGLFGNIFGGLQSFFGGAPLVESRAAGVRVETGEAIGETADLFRESASPANIFGTVETLRQGELIEGISVGEAIGASPLADRDSPLASFFNFFR